MLNNAFFKLLEEIKNARGKYENLIERLDNEKYEFVEELPEEPKINKLYIDMNDNFKIKTHDGEDWKILNEFSGGGGEFDGTIDWNNVINKPVKYPPTDHNHDNNYYKKSEIDNALSYISQTLTENSHKVKLQNNDEADYLSSKIDNVTISVEGNELKVKNIDGLTIGVTQMSSWLSGTNGNIQNQIDSLNDLLSAVSSGMHFIGKFETKSDLLNINIKNNGDLAVVLSDESQSNSRTMYVYSTDKGMWEFIGTFTFSDEFLALKDTPSSYDGQDRRVLKVDEINKKIIFDDIDYSELKNKPSSTITQIDDAVAKRHEHNNADSLAKLGVNSNGELTINGVVYAPKTEIPVKHCLYARRTGTEQTLEAGTTCVFNTRYVGDGIPYNTSTGVFTLEAGKTYRVFVTASIKTDGYVILRLVSASGNVITADNNQAIWMSVNPSNSNWKEASAGPLLAYITPATTQGFKIIASTVSGTSGLRPAHCALEIMEI